MRDRARVRFAPALAVVVTVTGTARAARADNDRALSIDLGWATFSAPGPTSGNQQPTSVSPTLGGALGIEYEHSVSTDFSLRGELLGGAYAGGATKKQSTGSYLGLADVGFTFRFDVLKYVPYAFAGVGGMVVDGGPIGNGGELALVIGGGLDVLTSREHSWGIEGRLAAFGGDVTVFTLGLRGTMRWGFF
jgi:hypothetical protein